MTSFHRTGKTHFSQNLTSIRPHSFRQTSPRAVTWCAGGRGPGGCPGAGPARRRWPARGLCRAGSGRRGRRTCSRRATGCRRGRWAGRSRLFSYTNKFTAFYTTNIQNSILKRYRILYKKDTEFFTKKIQNSILKGYGILY